MCDIVSSCIASLTQIAVGYPFDTIITTIQSKKPLFMKSTRNHLSRFLSLYRGCGYPLYSSFITNGTLFPIYERLTPYTQSSWISGFIGGAIVSPLLFLFDVGKIRCQTFQSLSWTKLLQCYSFPGKKTTFARESIAFSVYFGTYDWAKEQNLSSFIGGGIAGLANWTVTYPIDVIRTRQVIYQYSIADAYQMGHLWKGFPICAFRAVLVNACIFSSYEITRDFITIYS